MRMNNFEEVLTHVEKSDQEKDDKSQYPGQRILLFLLILGSILAMALRLNLSIAIVEMTSNKTITVNNQTNHYPADFQWDSKTKALVMSSFYYGFLLCPLGGYISIKWGGIRAHGIGLLVTAILTIMTPINLRLNVYWFIFSRIFEGIAETLTYTSISEIWAKWSALEDCSKLLSLTFTGSSIGSFITFPVCGYIAHKFGWPFIFYFTGGATIVWYIAWISFTRNEPPSTTSSIRKSEAKKVPPPWKEIVTSRPVLILSLGKFAFGWAYNLISVCLPLYIKDTVNVNTSENGLLSGIPNILPIFAIPLIGYSVGLCIKKKWMTPTQTHKMFNVTGLLGAAVVIISIVLTRNFTFIMIYLTLFKLFITCNSATIQIVPLYIAPKYPSLVAGVTGEFYTLGNMMVPIFIGNFVTKNTSAQWDIVFISTGAMLIIIGIIFWLFSSSEPQPWGMDHYQPEHKTLTNHE